MGLEVVGLGLFGRIFITLNRTEGGPGTDTHGRGPLIKDPGFKLPVPTHKRESFMNGGTGLQVSLFFSLFPSFPLKFSLSVSKINQIKQDRRSHCPAILSLGQGGGWRRK